MSDATNDPISIGDLFAAFGAAPADQSQGASAPAKKSAPAPRSKAAAGEDDASDVADVMAALGIAPSAQIRHSAASTKERKERTSAREEQIREQQIRSQQWQRELEEQQRRRQLQAEREAEMAEPEVAQQPQAKKNGFREDTTRIAEPSFLDKRTMPEASGAAAIQPLEQAETRKLPEQGAEAAQPAQAAVQPAAHEAAASEPAAHEPSAAAAVSPEWAKAHEAAPAAAAAQPAAEAQAAAPAEATGQLESQPTMPVDAPAADAQEQPRNAVDTPAAASASAIKPLSESAASAASSAPAQHTAREALAAEVPTVQKAPATQVIAPIAQSSALNAVEEKPVQPAAASNANASAAAPAAGSAPSVAPAPATAPVPPPAPAAVPLDASGPIPRPIEAPKREKQGVNKGNVLGIILIVIALVCAVLTIMLLTGTIDATTFSNLAGGATSPQEESVEQLQMEETSSAAGATASQAVYGYVVRGTDGGTHQATETATFGPDGNLESSSIVIDVADEAQAQGLLEQLQSDFGESVQDSGIRDGEVYLTIQIDRDDLDVDSYTELLSSNMAEFKVIEAGKLE